MQEEILVDLDDLSIAVQKKRSPFLWLNRWSRAPVASRSIYLYGPVGRGKTYLMDLFFKSVQAPKARFHFYELMNRVHAELKLFQGERNPLNKVAKNIAKGINLLCLDEFFVEDIADAMILSCLLKALFDTGLTLVVTSNVEPSQLYKDGLKRDHFKPAIDLIEAHMKILRLSHPQDYRFIAQEKEVCYPRESGSDHTALALPHTFKLNKHLIHAEWRKTDSARFDFSELCIKSRLAKDYLILAKMLKTIFISHVPQFTEANEDAARRFISLIDICYDKQVQVVLDSNVPIDELYQGKRLRFQFERTQSRLFEMLKWSTIENMQQALYPSTNA